MKLSTIFLTLAGVAALTAAVAGCGTSGPAPLTVEQPPPPTSTPASNVLYVDHNGTLYAYRLPLAADSKPIKTLPEWPGLAVAPQIAVDQYGNVAVSSPTAMRFFHPPIVSLAASHAYLGLKLTPSITNIGAGGADLSDIEYDASENVWLFNNLGPAITELRSPISKRSVAALSIAFGAPGSKTAGYTTLVQGRFDINAALYVYASSSTQSRLFKISFPYGKPPGSLGIDLQQADFVDSSEWPPTAPNAPSLLLGQYFGQLQSPKPGSPPSPPVTVTAQFPQPFNPSQGRFPNAHVAALIGALAADTYRYSFYTLDAGTGDLDVWGLPMAANDKSKLRLRCLGGPTNCSHKSEHLFLAP